MVVERRYADGQTDRLAAMATELVRLKVDVILGGGPATRDAASQATRTIPIVTVSGSDPVREGWAQSLARPGGNITGLTVTYPGLPLKALAILKEAFPGLVRVAVLIAPPDLADAKQVMEEMEAGARQLGLDPQGLEVRSPEDFDAAFGLARQRRAQALYAFATNIVVTHRSRLAALAAGNRLPSFSQFPLLAQAGFLMTYGADIEDLGRRSITHMDKILKGARPGDLPIERPTKLQLSINLKTANTLGVTIPQSLLLRADEVIQ